MIIELTNTTTSQIARRLVEVREEGGALALSRVLTLVVVNENTVDEEAIRAANEASSEHPMRVIVIHTSPDAETQLDAEIRVGRDAGAGEVVVLHASGEAAADAETLVQGLLLPDAPVVVWWPRWAGGSPSTTPLGRLAAVRIVDEATNQLPHCASTLERLRRLAPDFHPGDAHLDWTRITGWRAQLAAVLDQPPFETVLGARVVGRAGSTVPLLMSAWLQHFLEVPVEIVPIADETDEPLSANSRVNLYSVTLKRNSGSFVLERIDADTLRFSQEGQPEQLIPLPVRTVTEVLTEELRSLAPDEVYADVLLRGVPRLQLDDHHGAQ